MEMSVTQIIRIIKQSTIWIIKMAIWIGQLLAKPVGWAKSGPF